jgi:hypothetical protein
MYLLGVLGMFIVEEFLVQVGVLEIMNFIL